MLTNTALIKELISKNGFTLEKFANEIGLTRQGLDKKINNKSEFKQSEITAVAKLLHLDKKQVEDIFLSHLLAESHN